MEKRGSERRKASRDVVFPICDSLGTYVGEDRRSGLDRRKEATDKIAFRIIEAIGR